LHSASSLSQRSYTFDYQSEYEYRKLEGSKPSRRWFLTNSTDNTYYAFVTEAVNNEVVIRFRDRKTGLYSYIKLPREKFFDVATLKLKCKNVGYIPPLKKRDQERYDIFVKNDTIINSVSYKQYAIGNPQIEGDLQDKYGDGVCIIENNTEFHKPLTFAVFISAEREKEFPHGIMKQMFFKNDDEQTNEKLYNLKTYTKVKKVIVIPDECAFGPEEKK
jgi:hypothetical protein